MGVGETQRFSLPFWGVFEGIFGVLVAMGLEFLELGLLKFGMKVGAGGVSGVGVQAQGGALRSAIHSRNKAEKPE